MTAMLEKMASAGWPYLWEAADTTTAAHNEARARLRAALLVIREPDQAIELAGINAPNDPAGMRSSTGTRFTAMIDAILGIVYLTYQSQGIDMEPRDRPDEIEVTQEMIAAGVRRLQGLPQSEIGSAYVVEEVYRAMANALPTRAT